MNIDVVTARLLRTLLIGGTIVLAMAVAAQVLKPLALAILLTFLLVPIVGRLERLGLPRALSVAVVLLAGVAVAAATGYVLARQFASLAHDAPRYAVAIREKLDRLQPADESVAVKIQDAAETLGKPDETEAAEQAPTPVRLVRENNLWERLAAITGPFESVLAIAGVVLLLTVFLLLERDAVGDKIIRLVGWGRIGVTAKTLSQIGTSLGNYLMALALVNVGFGATIGLGCWAIGLPSPALWGFMAAILRFIPYLGTILSFSLPFGISIAAFPGWTQPILVLGLFAAAEGAVTALEPLIYGKSTGISPVGFLVSALFWAWLWGPLGLLLANAMTVCLAVAGRHVPGLGALGTLLGEDVAVADDLRWYQRLVSRDPDAALTLLDEALAEESFEEVCDRIVIPTLRRAERDRVRGNLEARDVALIWRVVRDWLDDVPEREGLVLSPPAPESQTPAAEPRAVAAVAMRGGGDALVLRMLNLTLAPADVRVAIVSAGGTALKVADKIGELEPAMILISHLPPVGMARARYMTKRMRTRHPHAELTFAYWDRDADTSQIVERLNPVAANHVVVSLAEARALILGRPDGSPIAVKPAPSKPAAEPARA